MEQLSKNKKVIGIFTLALLCAITTTAGAFLAPTTGTTGYTLYDLAITLYNTGLGFLFAFGFGGAGFWQLGHNNLWIAICCFIAAAGFFVLPTMVNNFGLIL
ncbi:hypothetical protein FO488_00385 [Geobacter sp. FeAm09]|uniref:hypothetical protein n=1 Tax=Geobacter sp. FeAm09 TaxID=2597769 RepID=UPI0011EF9532|nr:hypothetical protein [Geobacter sp. FeAm09]QEM66764.1 hypothetical protein FO488_00385 [Geobacter sp. FeAm09]